jgi:hypothetical protein
MRRTVATCALIVWSGIVAIPVYALCIKNGLHHSQVGVAVIAVVYLLSAAMVLWLFGRKRTSE